jgi:hypothetical protein
MKKGTLIAAIVTPVVAASTGVMIARAGNADASDASGYCMQPTVYVDMAEGVSMITGGANADCDGPSCTVAGLEQVEVNDDGRVQCVAVGEGQSLTMTRQDDGLSLLIEDIAAR